MNIDKCVEEDGNYTLLECLDYQAEFELIVKDGKPSLFENNYGIVIPIDEDNFILKCDLYENEGWEKDE